MSQCHVNYHPIPLLSFFSKILKRLVATQISNHIISSNLYEPFYSDNQWVLRQVYTSPEHSLKKIYKIWTFEKKDDLFKEYIKNLLKRKNRIIEAPLRTNLRREKKSLHKKNQRIGGDQHSHKKYRKEPREAIPIEATPDQVNNN